jgi:hypothetical protein
MALPKQGTKLSIGNLYFCLYRSLPKICKCLTATYCPQTLGSCTQVTQDGGNKLPVKVLTTNFLLLVCRLGRAPGQTRMASCWRGHVWALKKSGMFGDSAHSGTLNFSRDKYIFFYAWIIKVQDILCQQRLSVGKGPSNLELLMHINEHVLKNSSVCM